MALLDGKVTLVSGAGPGLGRDVALACGREGATVVVAARTEEKVQALAAEVEAAGAPALGLRLDITDAGQCRAVVERIVDAYGRLDVLVNNAFDDGDRTPFLEADLDRWRRTTEVNLFGTLQLTQACAPQMVAQRDGRIVMVNSMSAVRIRPGWGAYTASKAGLAAVTKVLAAELGAHGVRVNGVHPGYIWGDSVETLLRVPGEEEGHHLRGAVPRGGVRDRPRLPAALERDRRGRRVLRVGHVQAHHRPGARASTPGQWFQGF